MIKATGIGISFKLKKQRRLGAQDAVMRLFSRNHTSEKFWALKDVNLEVAAGETLGVIGPNGSGKSTLLRILAGIYLPDEGSVTVEGNISTLLSSTAGFQSDLTGIENIYMSGVLMGFDKTAIGKRLSKIVEYSELGDWVNQPVRTYSSGMYTRLGFSVAVHADGDVLLIDEVLGAGDASFAEKARETMAGLLREGRTVVLVSHGMEAIRKFSNRVMWLRSGNVVMIGDTNEVVNAYTAGGV